MPEPLPPWIPALLRDLLASGGAVVALLLLMGVIALAVCLLTCWQLWRCGVYFGTARRRLSRLVERSLAGQPPPPRPALPAEVIAANVVDLARLQGWPAKQLIDEGRRQLGMYRHRLLGNLSLLELIATLAPSLGLFGTVLGMIEAFQAMEQAGEAVDPAVLSGGIWKALLTTAMGLAVAMPAIVALNWINRRVANHLAGVDDQLSRLLNALAAARHPAAAQRPARRDPH